MVTAAEAQRAAHEVNSLVVPPDRPLSPLERATLPNISSNGVGICAISHDQLPVGSHQCIGPGMAAGMRFSVLMDIDDGEEDEGGSGGE